MFGRRARSFFPQLIKIGDPIRDFLFAIVRTISPRLCGRSTPQHLRAMAAMGAGVQPGLAFV